MMTVIKSSVYIKYQAIFFNYFKNPQNNPQRKGKEYHNILGDYQ